MVIALHSQRWPNADKADPLRNMASTCLMRDYDVGHCPLAASKVGSPTP